MSFVLSPGDLQPGPCPVCSAAGPFTKLATHDRYGMGIVTVLCDTCGLIHTNPRPTPAFVDAFYSRHYRTVYSKVAEPSVEYLERHGIPQRMAHSAALLGRLGLLGPGISILDVGCSEGSFLRAIAAASGGTINAWGVEPGPAFAAFAEKYAGCTVVPNLDRVPADLRFDLVLVNHVLEHVQDPVGFIRRLASLLRPGGALFIDVPDARAYSSLADLHLAHVLHFTPTTLVRTAAAAGAHAHTVVEHTPPRHPISIAAVLRCEAPAEPVGAKADDQERSVQAVRNADRWFAYQATRFVRRVFGGIARRLGLRRR